MHTAYEVLIDNGPWPIVLGLCLLLAVAVAAALRWARSGRTAVARAYAAINAGDFAQARVWAERAVRRARGDLALAAALDVMGAVHRFAGAYGEAEGCYRRALALRERALPPDAPAVGASLHNLALSVLASGRAAEAEPLYRRAAAVARSARGDDALALALGGLGQACIFLGRLDESADLLDEALHLTERTFGRDHARTAETLMLGAGCATVRGLFHQADLAYRECRAVREGVLGPDHPLTRITEQQHANLLTAWARLTGDAAALAEAETLAERCVERAQADFGPDHHLTADGQGTLACVRTRQGRPAEAVELARQALRAAEATVGPEAMLTALTRLRLARALDEAGAAAEAEVHAGAALPTYERLFGPDHQEIGAVYEVLGRLAARRGRLAEAEGHLRRALSVREPLGPAHPLRAFTLRELAPLLRQGGRADEAARAAHEADAIVAAARTPGGRQASRGRDDRVRTGLGTTSVAERAHP
jgi:tetratricopeptide (TPR) repeat protein